MLFDHGPEILFDTPPPVVSIDKVANNLEPRIGPFFHFLYQAVNISGSFNAIVLSLEGNN